METTPINYEPYILTDEVSEGDMYIGVSNNGLNQSAEIWKIKRVWKSGSVWYMGFPDGKQSFNHKWTDRLSYTYI